MKQQESISVVLINDHRSVLDSLEIALNTWDEVEVIGKAVNLAHACELCHQFKPQIAIVDMVLKNESGTDFLNEVKIISPLSRVIVLSGITDHELMIKALHSGARGYILKQAIDMEQLVIGIQAVAQGSWLFCKQTYNGLPNKEDYEPYRIL